MHVESVHRGSAEEKKPIRPSSWPQTENETDSTVSGSAGLFLTRRYSHREETHPRHIGRWGSASERLYQFD